MLTENPRKVSTVFSTIKKKVMLSYKRFSGGDLTVWNFREEQTSFTEAFELDLAHAGIQDFFSN